MMPSGLSTSSRAAKLEAHLTFISPALALPAGEGSTIAVSSASGSAATCSMCLFPIMPAPSTASLTARAISNPPKSICCLLVSATLKQRLRRVEDLPRSNLGRLAILHGNLDRQHDIVRQFRQQFSQRQLSLTGRQALRTCFLDDRLVRRRTRSWCIAELGASDQPRRYLPEVGRRTA